ncbi:hypothetical protein [Breoghania sp.]|nr:hypothetical protein [Breoghania sp.]MDJ0930931.1 hypothetical protein [Breoghania sp.]
MSEFEWAAHKQIALKAGISQNIVEAIRTGRTPVFTAADEIYAEAVEVLR